MLVKEFVCVLLYYDFQDTYFTGPSIDRGIRVFVSHPGGVDRVTLGEMTLNWGRVSFGETTLEGWTGRALWGPHPP